MNGSQAQFDGRIIRPAGIEHVHEQVLEFEMIEACLNCTACPGAIALDENLLDHPEPQFEHARA